MTRHGADVMVVAFTIAGVDTGEPLLVRTHPVSPGPPVAHVPRPELTARLVEALAERLTLVVAPGGYGKTTALADATRSLRCSVAWARVDRHADDRDTAWQDVAQTVETAVGAVGSTPATPDAAGVRELARRLGRGAHDLVVVVDVDGVLDDGTAALLDALVDWAPPQVRFVVAARTEPRLSVERRRAAGPVLEFGMADLRFSEAEVVHYLRNGWHLDVGANDARALAHATEGWPAVLHLVALELARGADPHDLDSLLRRRPVVAYLARQVLDVADRDDVGILAATLEVDVLTAVLCDGVTGRGDGAARLAALARAGVVVARDEGGHRHHRMVRAVMRGPGGEPRVTPREITTILDAHLLAGNRDRLDDWEDRLDVGRAGDPTRLARTRVAGHVARLRGARPGGETSDPGGPGALSHAHGVADALAGNHDRASTLLRHARRVGAQEGRPLWELAVLGDLALQQALAGRLSTATTLARHAAQQAAELCMPAPPTADLAVAQVAMDRGADVVALGTAAACRDAVAPGGDTVAWVEASLMLSRLHVSRGDTTAAEAMLDEVHREVTTHGAGPELLARTARAEASLRLAAGDADAIPHVLPELLCATSVDELGPADRVLLAQVHLRRGATDRAAAFAALLEGAGAGPRLEVAALRVAMAAARRRGDVALVHRLRRRMLAVARAAGVAAPPPPRGRTGSGLAPVRDRPDPGLSRSGSDGTTSHGLTRRELAVLRQLPWQLSNAEVADRLYVSVNTVKSHLKSIYRKLGVSSRRDAIARARELGLVDP